jgi:hypothetical protein
VGGPSTDTRRFQTKLQKRENNFSGAMMSILPFAASDRRAIGQSKLFQALDKSSGESALLDLLPYTDGAGQRRVDGERQRARTYRNWELLMWFERTRLRRWRLGQDFQAGEKWKRAGRAGGHGLKNSFGSDQRRNSTMI